MSGVKKFLEFDLRIKIYHIKINKCYIEKQHFIVVLVTMSI